MAKTYRTKPSTALDDLRAKSNEQTEIMRENSAFWKLFMPRYVSTDGKPNPPVDVYTAEACTNILDALQDMIGDVLAQFPAARRSLTLASNPPVTAETMILKLRAQFTMPKAAP